MRPHGPTFTTRKERISRARTDRDFWQSQPLPDPGVRLGGRHMGPCGARWTWFGRKLAGGRHVGRGADTGYGSSRRGGGDRMQVPSYTVTTKLTPVSPVLSVETHESWQRRLLFSDGNFNVKNINMKLLSCHTCVTYQGLFFK